jgi:hypothetical protein
VINKNKNMNQKITSATDKVEIGGENVMCEPKWAPRQPPRLTLGADEERRDTSSLPLETLLNQLHSIERLG